MASPKRARTVRSLPMDLDQRVCDRARLARDPRFDGRFFIGVTSTGIFCRPICPSPTARRENVRYFQSAQEAAAAGFRPCLRCRPETAPGTPAWKGTSATVGRALRLIAEGALQEQGLAELSRRLGVSVRHLHRLFLTHLGASPIAVANTWRLNFAKQLIHDTDLPMSRVALASGFRTVRRFNDSIKRLYGRTPSDLRRTRRSSVPHARGDEYVFRLPYCPPYDWESLVAFFSKRAIPGVEEVVAGSYRRSFKQEGRHGVLEVQPDARVPALEVRVRFSEPLSLLPIVDKIRGMFDLETDPSAITEQFLRDPFLARLARRYPGLRVPGGWDPFELSVLAILGERSAPDTASALAGELARRFGEPLQLSDTAGLAVVFPAPRALTHLRLLGLPHEHARAIRLLARSFASGRLDLARSEEPFLKGLARARGIGKGTAQYVAMRCFRRPDAFPADDPALLLAVAHRRKWAAASALERLAERWRPWRAYAAVYLWRAAEEDASRPSRRPATSTRPKRGRIRAPRREGSAGSPAQAARAS